VFYSWHWQLLWQGTKVRYTARAEIILITRSRLAVGRIQSLPSNNLIKTRFHLVNMGIKSKKDSISEWAGHGGNVITSLSQSLHMLLNCLLLDSSRPVQLLILSLVMYSARAQPVQKNRACYEDARGRCSGIRKIVNEQIAKWDEDLTWLLRVWQLLLKNTTNVKILCVDCFCMGVYFPLSPCIRLSEGISK
jgi:hypothetical protein